MTGVTLAIALLVFMCVMFAIGYHFGHEAGYSKALDQIEDTLDLKEQMDKRENER